MKEKKFYLPAEDFKTAEAVYLGYDYFYMTYKSAKAAKEMFDDLKASGWVESFQRVPSFGPVCKRRPIYKFTLTAEMIRRVKNYVLPTLPKNWFTVRQPWQAQ